MISAVNFNKMMSNRRSRSVVIILGGWSPGPLLYLKRVLASRGCVTVQPRKLPMPPIPGSWCCNPIVLTMTTVFAGLMYMSCAAAPRFIFQKSPLPVGVARLFILLISFVWFRLLAAVVVRTSIERSIRIANCKTEINEHGDPKDVLVIGFSWGGSVRLA